MAPERWQKIADLYHAARDRPPDQRAALLGQADPELRREVESLLAQDVSGTGVLDRPAWGTASTLTMPAPITAGTQLGTYKIEALIGEGGTGAVYRALDTKLNRPVAVKFLSDELADAAARRRFQREAQMASSLNHPHIVTVYDVAEFQGRRTRAD